MNVTFGISYIGETLSTKYFWIKIRRPLIPMDLAKRFNSSKPELGYILDMPYAMLALSGVKTYGTKKYGRDNWKKGLPVRSITDSLLRHLMAFHNGEDLDEESGLAHMAHVMWNAAAIIEVLARHGDKLDNRDK